MEKVSFIYEWTNLKDGIKYVGSHYGTFDDGYVSSSNYFNSFYKQSPSSFERKILKTFYSREDAFIEETKLLCSVDAAKNVNYYNLTNQAGFGWSHHKDTLLSKIFYKRISESKKGTPSKNKGIPISEEQKIKLSDEWVISGQNIEGEIVIVNMLKFCRENNLNPSAMSAVARGKRKQHRGYKCKKITNKRNVEYNPIEWKSKGKRGGASFGDKNKASKKVKVKGVIYDCINQASKETKLSRYLIKKIGDFNV